MMDQYFRPTNDPNEKRVTVKEAVSEAFSVTDLLMKGLLTNQQAFQLSRAYAIADLWESTYPKSSHLLKTLCDKLMQTSVSTKGKGGRGRDDMVKAIASIVSVNTDDKNMMRDNRVFGPR